MLLLLCYIIFFFSFFHFFFSYFDPTWNHQFVIYKVLIFKIKQQMGFISLSILQETEAMRRKLQSVKQDKLTLLAEVRYAKFFPLVFDDYFLYLGDFSRMFSSYNLRIVYNLVFHEFGGSNSNGIL